MNRFEYVLLALALTGCGGIADLGGGPDASLGSDSGHPDDASGSSQDAGDAGPSSNCIVPTANNFLSHPFETSCGNPCPAGTYELPNALNDYVCGSDSSLRHLCAKPYCGGGDADGSPTGGGPDFGCDGDAPLCCGGQPCQQIYHATCGNNGWSCGTQGAILPAGHVCSDTCSGDAGTWACGGRTCKTTEFCAVEGLAGPLCYPIPTSCASAPTCGCVEADLHCAKLDGGCTVNDAGHVIVGCGGD